MEKRRKLNDMFGDEEGDEDLFYDKTKKSKISQETETFESLLIKKNQLQKEIDDMRLTVSDYEKCKLFFKLNFTFV